MGKETSGKIHQNLVLPHRVLHTTQRLVYRRSQMTNLLLSDPSAFGETIELSRETSVTLFGGRLR
jgi:hypothetical protein